MAIKVNSYLMDTLHWNKIIIMNKSIRLKFRSKFDETTVILRLKRPLYSI